MKDEKSKENLIVNVNVGKAGTGANAEKIRGDGQPQSNKPFRKSLDAYILI